MLHRINKKDFQTTIFSEHYDARKKFWLAEDCDADFEAFLVPLKFELEFKVF